MQDGLYKVAFQTPLATGAGVLLLQKGRIWGGDSGFYFSGTYKLNGDQFTGSISANRHTAVTGMVSVFGQDKNDISFSGISKGKSADVTATSAQVPGIKMQARISRLSD